MSDNWLQLIAVDPPYQPTPDAAERARKLLATFAPAADDVSFRFSERMEFFHPGSNWQGVQCSACGADAAAWWAPAMDDAKGRQFSSLNVIAGCCGAAVSLNDLRYVWPAGFARFVLEAMNPNVGDLQSAELEALSGALRTPLRRIWVHL